MPKKKVLVVDDSPTIRNIIQIYLMGRPLEFVEASDGVRGLQLARLLGVDLVIADVNMPNMNGFTLVKRIREEAEPLSHVPIILLTGNKEAGEREALECGANAFVRKPVTSSDLVRVVTWLVPEAAP